MALGPILERFWGQVGGQNGAKLAAKSEKWGSEDNVKKRPLNHERGITRDHGSNGGVGPYKPLTPRPPGDSQWAIRHSTSCLGGTVADMVM